MNNHGHKHNVTNKEQPNTKEIHSTVTEKMHYNRLGHNTVKTDMFLIGIWMDGDGCDVAKSERIPDFRCYSTERPVTQTKSRDRESPNPRGPESAGHVVGEKQCTKIESHP